VWYNLSMDNLSLFTLILACATFFLALAAFWSIWQNQSIQKKEKKEKILNEINILAMEFQELVFISGTSDDFDHTQWSIRFSNLLFNSSAVEEYGRLFGTDFKNKADIVNKCVYDYRKELTSQQSMKEGKIFLINRKERLEIRDRVIESVTELKQEILKEKVKLCR
jgi:hypothetical protein